MRVTAQMLASGSSGNSMLLTAGTQHLLVDAGIGPRILCAALNRRGVNEKNLVGVILTHEHDDHIRGLAGVCKRYSATLYANANTLSALSQRVILEKVSVYPTGTLIELGPFRVRSFPISHDAAEPVGFTIFAGSTGISYITDLGIPNDDVRESMQMASLCVIESNHDLQWLMRGSYPPIMKQRVSGPFGHLSNSDAADLIVGRLKHNLDVEFWLAHLSANNNSPSVARHCILTRLLENGIDHKNIHVARRDMPSLVWHNNAPDIQLSLF